MTKIVQLKISRQPDLVWLHFDNGKYLPVFVDDVYRLSLKKGDQLSSQKVDEIYNLSFAHLLYQYSLRQLSSSAKSRRVLEMKLKNKLYLLQKKYSPVVLNSGLINQTISRLDQNNLLDERQYVVSVIRRHPKWSSCYLNSYLLSQGIDFRKYRDLLSSDDLEKIKPILHQQGTSPKTISKLIRKGFALSSIKKAIDDLPNSG